jgi:hypothetical protein
MFILSSIATALPGHDCEKLVKRTEDDIKLSGVAIVAGPIDIKFGDFSRVQKQLIKSSDIAVSLDDSQVLLCQEISKLKDGDLLKDDCRRIRLQITLGMNQLRGILGTLKEQPDDPLKKELAEWVKFMSKLHKQSISVLKPGRMKGLRKGAMEIAQIMKYQGINEAQMQEAMKIL